MKKINYILAAVALLLGVSTAQAQSVEDNYPYNFITIQGGAQGTFTNYDFTKLITPQAAVSFGRYFNSKVGARAHFQGWQKKGAINDTYKFNAVTGDLDLLMNMSNIINPNRTNDKFDWVLLAGFGVNYGWDFDEYWEVITPYKADFEFNPLTLQIDSARPPKNHGWAHSTSREAVMCSTADYVEGRIFRKTLYTMEHTDDRIARLYFTRVKQRSISREEYEYEMFRRKLSNEMGGLFTPMPAELPTNLHCENGQKPSTLATCTPKPPLRSESTLPSIGIWSRKACSTELSTMSPLILTGTPASVSALSALKVATFSP